MFMYKYFGKNKDACLLVVDIYDGIWLWLWLLTTRFNTPSNDRPMCSKVMMNFYASDLLAYYIIVIIIISSSSGIIIIIKKV